MSSPVKKYDKTKAQLRTNLRLAPELFRSIDAARSRRPGNISRNTWITEAVLEKLAKERNEYDNDNKGGPHV